MGDQCVELVGRILVVVAETGKSHADTEGNVPGKNKIRE